MGMYDEVILACPKCSELTPFQSKRGAYTLERFHLNTAPLPLIADLHDEGKRGDLICIHCGIKMKLNVQIKTKLVAADDPADSDDWRDMG